LKQLKKIFIYIINTAINRGVNDISQKLPNRFKGLTCFASKMYNNKLFKPNIGSSPPEVDEQGAQAYDREYLQFYFEFSHRL